MYYDTIDHARVINDFILLYCTVTQALIQADYLPQIDHTLKQNSILHELQNDTHFVQYEIFTDEEYANRHDAGKNR